MRPFLALALIASCALPVTAESFTSSTTQLRKKTIYARAAGEVSQLVLRNGQVFLWDELAASVKPSKSVKAEFGRAYSDFAGAVTRVLVAPGQQVEKGDPLYECLFLEHVYTSCVVPASLGVKIDQPLTAKYKGQTFEGKVLAVDQQGETAYVRVLIYNSREERYWHLTPGLQLALNFAETE